MKAAEPPKAPRSSPPATRGSRGLAATAVGPTITEDDLDDFEADADDAKGASGRTTTTRSATAKGATTGATATTGTTTGTPQSAQTRAARRASQSESLDRALGRSRGGRAATPTGRGRGAARPDTATRRTSSHRAGAGRTRAEENAAVDDEPLLPRGRVAAAVAGVLSTGAATVGTWRGGARAVDAGHWMRIKIRRYLDGPRPERMTLTGLRWQHRRRTAYAALGAGVGLPLLMFVLGWLFIPIPNADEAVESQLNTVSYADGSLLARVAPTEQGNRQKVSINQIPVPVQHAVLSAEDRTFLTNSGFDVAGIVRAAFKQATGGVGGGSTITQQYVKNAMVGDEYSLARKYKELIISTKLNQEMSKGQILELYLNSIYFGRGAYGIQAASQAYFNKPVQALSPAEGALLAGIIQSPSRWDPAVKPDDSMRRWTYVMDGMVTSGWLSPADRAAARFPATVPPRKVTNGVPDDDRGHIYNMVRDELRSLGIDDDAMVTQGLHIETTIQPQDQQEAADASHKAMAGQPGNLRTATVSIDPRNGDVLAYYGGDNGSGLDYGQVLKQAGSTFKPFVLLAALERNPPIGVSTEFDGQSVPGKTVRNVDGADCSECNLKQAMTLSNNVVFNALGMKVGVPAIVAAAHQAGITQPITNPTSGIALGSVDVTPLQMASAYATFANGGVYYKPHLVQKVTTASGEVLYDHATDPGEQRIDPKVARNVTEAMRDVAQADNNELSGGRVAAAKTGTVQSHVEDQNNDAWMVGYTPSASTASWVGTDDNSPIKSADGKPLYGKDIPGKIWQAFMDDALAGTPKQTFGAFVPVAGGDPGDSVDASGRPIPENGDDSSSSTSSSPSSSSSSASRSSAPPKPSRSEPPPPQVTPSAPAPAPVAPVAPAEPAATTPAAVDPTTAAGEDPTGG